MADYVSFCSRFRPRFGLRWWVVSRQLNLARVVSGGSSEVGGPMLARDECLLPFVALFLLGCCALGWLMGGLVAVMDTISCDGVG